MEVPTRAGQIQHDPSTLIDLQWMCVKDAADYLGISEWTIWRWIRTGRCQARGSRGCIRVRPKDILPAYRPAKGRAK
jgi:excisionase family DNA binding protein